jgi:hypothetical protein
MIGSGNGYNCSFFGLMGTHAEFWTSTEINSFDAKNWSTNNQSASMFRHYNQEKQNNFSVRCVSNSSANIHNIQKNKCSIYPNPFSKETEVSWTFHSDNIVILIENCFGQKIKEIFANNTQKIKLSRNELLSGLYYITIISDQKMITKEKLIIVD